MNAFIHSQHFRLVTTLILNFTSARLELYANFATASFALAFLWAASRKIYLFFNLSQGIGNAFSWDCLRSWPSKRGQGYPPGFLNFPFSYCIFSKKGSFLRFERVKWNFTVCALPGKIFLATSGKMRYWPLLEKIFRCPCLRDKKCSLQMTAGHLSDCDN